MNNKKELDVSSWAQFCVSNGQICRLDKDVKQEMSTDEIVMKISKSIYDNRCKYIEKYDELHGEGSYEKMYCMKSVYEEGELDDFMEEEEEDEDKNYDDECTTDTYVEDE